MCFRFIIILVLYKLYLWNCIKVCCFLRENIFSSFQQITWLSKFFFLLSCRLLSCWLWKGCCSLLILSICTIVYYSEPFFLLLSLVFFVKLGFRVNCLEPSNITNDISSSYFVNELLYIIINAVKVYKEKVCACFFTPPFYTICRVKHSKNSLVHREVDKKIQKKMGYKR